MELFQRWNEEQARPWLHPIYSWNYGTSFILGTTSSFFNFIFYYYYFLILIHRVVLSMQVCISVYSVCVCFVSGRTMMRGRNALAYELTN